MHWSLKRCSRAHDDPLHHLRRDPQVGGLDALHGRLGDTRYSTAQRIRRHGDGCSGRRKMRCDSNVKDAMRHIASASLKNGQGLVVGVLFPQLRGGLQHLAREGGSRAGGKEARDISGTRH